MKNGNETKNRLLQKALQEARKTAIKGAGIPSHKGTFEPRIPDIVNKLRRGGCDKYKINKYDINGYIASNMALLIGLRLVLRALL